MPVVEPAPRRRYAMLDVWRGVACLMVVVFHATYYARLNPAGEGIAAWAIGATARGWMGVPIFFVISGYCISAAAESVRGSRQSVGAYFQRRLRRIFPPYWVTLAGTLVLVVAVDARFPGFFTDDPNGIAGPSGLTVWQWLGNATLSEGWRRHFVADRSQYFLGHAWTLGYEEQFYAVTGALLLLPRRWFFGGAAAVTGLTLGLFLAKRAGAEFPIDGFFLDGRWLLFAAGMLVYYRANWAGPRMRWVTLLPLVGGIAWAAHAPWTLATAKSNFWQELFVSSAFALLITLIQPFDAQFARLPALRPLGFLGRMCFSLYLVHLPVVKAASHLALLAGLTSDWAVLLISVPVCVGLAVGAAWVFHRHVERRFLNPPTSQAG